MQHFMDLQANSELGESNSWLSVKEQSGAAPNTNLDRVLFNDLVEIVPLVQSLIVNPSNPFHCNAKKRDFFLKFYLSARGKGNKTTTWEMGIMYFGLYCVGFVC